QDNHPSALSPSPSPSVPDVFHGEVIEIEGQGSIEEIVRMAYTAEDDLSDYGESEVETEDRPIDQVVPPTKEKLQPSDPHAVSVYVNRTGWIRPPPIERPFEITRARRLVHFIPRRLPNGLMAMFEHSRRAGFPNGPSPEHSNLFVDRFNGRILDVGEYLFPPGIVDSATFGVPGPRTYFFEWHGLHGWRATVPTTWMYRANELSEGQWVGRVPSQPNPGQLPLLSPAITSDQQRSYNLQLRRIPARKKAKGKLPQSSVASHVSAVDASRNDFPSSTGLPELIALDNAFVGLSARDVWNSNEVAEMRRRQCGPRSITRLQSRVIFQFRSQDEERQAWLYFGRLRQLDDARMDVVTPADFAEVALFASDIWDYDREDAAMDYSVELPLVGTSSRTVEASSTSRRTAVPAVQYREQRPLTPPIASTSTPPLALVILLRMLLDDDLDVLALLDVDRLRVEAAIIPEDPTIRTELGELRVILRAPVEDVTGVGRDPHLGQDRDPRLGRVASPEPTATISLLPTGQPTTRVPEATASPERPMVVQASDGTEPWNHPDFASLLEKERAKVRRKRDKKHKEAGLDPRPLPEPPILPVIRNSLRPRPLLLDRMDLPPVDMRLEEPEPQWSSAERSLLDRLRNPPDVSGTEEPVLLRRMRPIQERFALTLSERMTALQRLRDPTPESAAVEAVVRSKKNARQEARDYARAVAISEVEDVLPPESTTQATSAPQAVVSNRTVVTSDVAEGSRVASSELAAADSTDLRTEEAMDVDPPDVDVDMDDTWRLARRKGKKRAKNDIDAISLDSDDGWEYDDEA
ncbi:hypothetical protein C8F01DRAFT_1319330, partial [Mycena amicta]